MTSDIVRSPYQRILLKLSGEALADESGFGIDPDKAEFIAQKVKPIHDLDVETSIVIGGGNLWRGEPAAKRGMDRSSADHIGILATVMNALALQDALERTGVTTRVQTAVEMKALAEPYIRLRAIRHLEKGRVVIFAGGLGQPYITTDTAAALRAAEIHADVIIKATQVDGIYSSDPRYNPDAVKYDHITYQEAIEKKLKVMDMTAFALCQENKTPIRVLNFWDENDLLQAVLGDMSIGTLVSDDIPVAT